MNSRFPCVTQGMERISLDFPRAAKIIGISCVPCKWGAVVCLDRECLEFVTAVKCKVKFYDFKI